VDQETYAWREGEVVLFDDTYEHEVFNQTEDLRAVLFLDVDRPMDRTGRWVNAVLVALIRSSAYVRDPIKNVAAWNRRRDQMASGAD
jgi:beta-hydroxylase